MTRLPIPGGDRNDWGTILNDYLSVAHAADGKLKAGSVSESTLDAAARTKLNASGGDTGQRALKVPKVRQARLVSLGRRVQLAQPVPRGAFLRRRNLHLLPYLIPNKRIVALDGLSCLSSV